jgi:hypothetical protein
MMDAYLFEDEELETGDNEKAVGSGITTGLVICVLQGVVFIVLLSMHISRDEQSKTKGSKKKMDFEMRAEKKEYTQSEGGEFSFSNFGEEDG